MAALMPVAIRSKISKSEIRNSKQYQMTEIQNPKMERGSIFLRLRLN
jgi:hypothetical protein